MAISKFSEEMIGEDIRIIETQSMQILYQNAEKLVVVGLFLNGINKPIAESLLRDISNLFIEKYASYLAVDQLANVNLFRDFAAEIEDRYGTKTVCFNYAKSFLKRGQKPTNVYDSLKGLLERHRKGVMNITCNVNP